MKRTGKVHKKSTFRVFHLVHPSLQVRRRGVCNPVFSGRLAEQYDCRAQRVESGGVRLGALRRRRHPRLVILDDTIQAIDARRLARRYLGPNRRAVAVLAGVQSNQFPRASDLAVRLRPPASR
jgi:hypothetical protein